MCEKYSGWTNRETWATALWMDNEQGLSYLVSELAETALKDNLEDRAGALYELSQEIENLWEEAFSDIADMTQAGLDMLKDIGSLYRVNWRELAEVYLATAEEDAEANA